MRLNVFDIQNFKRFFAARSRVFGDVADSFADQGFGQRRRQGYFVLFDICLIVADNLVLFFFIGIFVNHLNGGAETDNVSFGVGDVNNLGTA